MDRPSQVNTVGYLRVDGRGECRARDLRRLLTALEDSYQAIARVELAAARSLRTLDWMERYGRSARWRLPPPDLWAASAPGPTVAADPPREPAAPLIVTRVVLESPGFWEFLGGLNPLETLRQYLNDRHERKKDDEYRSDAEREQLAIENALRKIEVVQRLKELEREFGTDIYESQAWSQTWLPEVRPPLERLAELDDLGIIDGQSAEIRRRPEPPELTPGDA